MASMVVRRASALFGFMALLASVMVLGAPGAHATVEQPGSLADEDLKCVEHDTSTNYAKEIQVTIDGISLVYNGGVVSVFAGEGQTIVKVTVTGEESTVYTSGPFADLSAPLTSSGHTSKITHVEVCYIGELTPEPECTSTIGDYVWHDQNNDGIQDAGEAAIPGVAVQLVGDGIDLSTETNDSGLYQFTDLCAGIYKVRFHLPTLDGWDKLKWATTGAGSADSDSNANSDGYTSEITVGDGTSDMSWDAGVVGAAVEAVVVTTTTVVEDPTTTAEVEAVTSTTVAPVTASTLPFTGFELETTMMLGFLTLAGGAALLFGARRRPEGETGESLGDW